MMAKTNIIGTITGATINRTMTDAIDITLLAVTTTEAFFPKTHQRRMIGPLFTMRPHGSNKAWTLNVDPMIGTRSFNRWRIK